MFRLMRNQCIHCCLPEITWFIHSLTHWTSLSNYMSGTELLAGYTSGSKPWHGSWLQGAYTFSQEDKHTFRITWRHAKWQQYWRPFEEGYKMNECYKSVMWQERDSRTDETEQERPQSQRANIPHEWVNSTVFPRLSLSSQLLQTDQLHPSFL